MERDVKEVVGVLMRVLGGGETSREEVEDLAFEAAGELQVALNEAYVTLLEFAFDRETRVKDRNLDGEMRRALQHCLDEIVRRSDSPQTTDRGPSG